MVTEEQIRVLVVDDDADSADVLARLLTLEGMATSACVSSEDALEGAADVDVVVTDINLGRSSGIVLCRRLLELHERLVVIAMSGIAEHAAAATEAGARAFLLKPIDHLQLAEQIRALSDCVSQNCATGQ